MAKKKLKKSPKNGWILILVLIVVIGVILFHKPKTLPASTAPVSSLDTVAQPMSFDFSNQKIIIDNAELDFVSGAFKNAQHTATISTRGINPSETRTAAILVDNPGGSGTFYYLVGAMLKDGKSIYSRPILLGDRVKVVSVDVTDPGDNDNGIITVDYLDHAAGTAMADAPTQAITAKYAFQNDGNLISILH